MYGRRLFGLANTCLIRRLLICTILIPPNRHQLRSLNTTNIRRTLMIRIMRINLNHLFVCNEAGKVSRHRRHLILTINANGRGAPTTTAPKLGTMTLLQYGPKNSRVVSLTKRATRPHHRIITLSLGNKFIIVGRVGGRVYSRVASLRFPVASCLVGIRDPTEKVRRPLLVLYSFTL